MLVVEDFISLFFPRSCAACLGYLVRGESVICTRCHLSLPRTNYHLLNDNPLAVKMTGRLPLKHVWAFLKFRKKGIVQELLHQLKYNNHPEIGVVLGKLYGSELNVGGFSGAFDLIIPVPLHKSRLRKRGYNQSAKFAEGLASALDVPWSEGVSIRTEKTQTQTSMTKLERWENVKDVFAASATLVKGKRILLVDDVITTGATLEACGKHIVEAGCAELSLACLAEAQ